jgi:hypothetical protein
MSWFWWDDNTWVPYTPTLNKLLETAHSAGKAKVNVDDERFVDFKNMLQRRIDDPQKRRNVKREDLPAKKPTATTTTTTSKTNSTVSMATPSPMDDMVLLLIGKFPQSSAKKITDAGGLITPFLTPKVTHVVCKKADLEENLELLSKVDKKVPIVSELFINSVIEDEDEFDINPVLLNAEVEKLLKDVQKKEEKKPVVEKKKSADDDMMMDVDVPQSTNNTGEVNEMTEWYGVLTQDGSKIPFSLSVLSKKSSPTQGLIYGKIEWPTKGPALTKFNGSVTGTTVTIVESEVLSAKKKPNLNTFIGTIDNNRLIKGTIADGSLFTLKWTSNIPDSHMPLLYPNNTIKGAIIEEYPFTLNIKEKPDTKSFNGTVEWPTLDTVTKVKGSYSDIEKKEFIMTEHNYESGDSVSLPCTYTGSFKKDSKKIVGHYSLTGNENAGSFELSL